MSLPRLSAAAPLGLLAALTVPVAAQSMQVDVMNTRTEISGRMWGSGHWVLFSTEEDGKDLNGDGDGQDSVLCVGDLRALTVASTGIAVTYNLTDNDKDWSAAVSSDQNLVALQAAEADNGDTDLNKNGTATEDILTIYNPATKQKTLLNITGRMPTWGPGGKLYFGQPEAAAQKDLNGDGDARDLVLGSWDAKTGQVENLGAECSAGFKVTGDWIAVTMSEAGQGARDLNADRDTNDAVVQLYQVSAKRWINTGLESATQKEVQIQLTPRLLAVAVNEVGQGNRDLNGDRDARDAVLHVVTLPKDATSQISVSNAAQDCSGGISADGALVAFITGEDDQGNADLNGDKDTKDDVVQVYSLETGKVTNVGLEGVEGVYTAAGKVAIPVSETDQGNKDLNGDKDAEDYVLHLYDVARNRVTNTRTTVEQTLTGSEGSLMWKVLESDQGDRDLNRDGDTDDSIVALMDMATGNYSITGYATFVDEMCPVLRGGVFAVSETDQGGRDLNGDREMDDDVVVLVRKR